MPTPDHPPAAAAAGVYFPRTSYTPEPLPTFAALRPRLPGPVFDEQPAWVAAYWTAWEIAFRNFKTPEPGSRHVSNFIDAAFNQNIFQWDSCFMTMFCDVAAPLVPGISTLDNFYRAQHPDGEISREIDRATGMDFGPWRNTKGRPLFSRWGFRVPRLIWPGRVTYRGRPAPAQPPALTLDGLNHPLFAWSELEHYRWTGDRARLAVVWEPLVRYYRALHVYLRQGNGLFMTDWASMDNSPRNRFLAGGGTAVDTSAEMVLFARQLAEIGRVLGRGEDASAFDRDAGEIAQAINALMWDEARGFYFDLTREGRRAPVKTVAAYWTLIAGVASGSQAERLVAELGNPATFGRLNTVPTLAADEPGYRPNGGYWRGSTWAPINTMVIRGLEAYARHDLAREIAERHVRLVADVIAATGTIWENYAPDAPIPGVVAPGRMARKDFVGWSGIGPILFLLEHVIGLRPSAPQNALSWRLESANRCGCERFLFNGHTVALIAEPAGTGTERVIRITSDGPFQLALSWNGRTTSRAIPAGETIFTVQASRPSSPSPAAGLEGRR